MTIRLTDRKVLLSHPFVQITESRLSHPSPDGGWTEPMSRVNIDRGDAAAVLIHGQLENQDRIVLVRQFRYPTYDPNASDADNGWLVEVVAGVLANDEPPAVTARREAQEETGLGLSEVQHISSFFLSPGGSSERIHLFYGRLDDDLATLDLDAVHGVDNEAISLILMTPAEFLECVDSNQIEDAKTIIAAAWMRQQPKRFGLKTDWEGS